MGCLNILIGLLCVCGTALSYYAIYIEKAKTADKDFKPMCDLDETISCTTVLTSSYSRGFGIVGKILGEDHVLNVPTSYIGLVFFPIMLLLGISSSRLVMTIALLLSLISTLSSAYLIYVLVYILKAICLVCLPVHFVNILMFLLLTVKWNGGQKRRSKDD